MTRAAQRLAGAAACMALLVVLAAPVAAAAADLPSLTKPVNDFANIIDATTENELDQLIRSLQAASGDVVVVATVDTIAPYPTIEEYAVKLFENGGRGIGQKGKDNGLLIVVALKERRARIEVGYDLEQFITDGYAGETIRQVMIPEFRSSRYGAGILAGTQRIIGRIAQQRGVTLTGVEPPREERRAPRIPISLIIFIIVLIVMSSRRRRGPFNRWGPGGWSGWSGGVGPFGGGFGGGFGGFGGGSSGGFGGGGFGGFGGGRSGGGGASGGW